MKTIVEISDRLLRRTCKIDGYEGSTFRTLVERGLRRVVAETKPGAPFKLRRATFKGIGLRTDMNEPSWDQLHDMAYKGRGG
jgi:hypothetical protein